MSNQVWLQCNRRDVQVLKTWLGADLSCDDKVRGSDLAGLMLIPTRWDEEKPLQLDGFPRDVLMKDVALVLRPCPSCNIPKVGVIEQAITNWLTTLPSALTTTSASSFVVANAPKRWSIYRPMVLLPSGSFVHPSWTHLLSNTTVDQQSTLWIAILQAITLKDDPSSTLTHLAINSGIPLSHSQSSSPSSSSSSSATDNIFRTPSGLVILYGDFGPALDPSATPSLKDFGEAFWVQTKQNGILQTWAPRYTMFSRGNVKEKARVLGFRSISSSEDQGSSSQGIATTGRRISAVDLYAGIGYFVFSYAKIGMRVWCWEINPWSVEGLRRGAVANGWSVKVVKDDEIQQSVAEIVFNDNENIIVFEEGNERASKRINELRATSKQDDGGGRDVLGAVQHVNCGFLPSSELSWRAALEALDINTCGFLHLHENVAVGDIESRREEVEKMIQTWEAQAGSQRKVKVVHVEMVKTFAPGVWHCVFDVSVEP